MTTVIFQYAPESKPEPLPKRTKAPLTATVAPDSGDELGLSFSAASDGAEEVELGLQSYSKGIFEKLPSMRFRDEDLDIPTYQRRNIHIDKGS